MFSRDGKEESLGLLRSSDNNAENASVIAQERPARIPRIERRLGLDCGGDPRNAFTVAPLVTWANLGDDTLRQGPEVGLWVTDDKHLLADVWEPGGDWQYNGTGRWWLHQAE